MSPPIGVRARNELRSRKHGNAANDVPARCGNPTPPLVNTKVTTTSSPAKVCFFFDDPTVARPLPSLSYTLKSADGDASLSRLPVPASCVPLMLRLCLCVSAPILLFFPDVLSAESIDFGTQVYPILKRACFECHGEQRQEAGLRLDRRGDVLDSGMIDGGHPHESELLRRVSLPKSDDQVMPAVGDPLPENQIAILERWIQQGAVWPESFEEGTHWSFVVPRRPKLPSVHSSDWPRNAIDFFVLRKLESEGMSPSNDAAPEKMVRRVFLDLIGLPPTPDEVESFVADPSDQNYERVVDDLLLRPQFGERWARPWLDLARYADSHGFQRDNFRDIWAYRDWVIRALNQDMPFDQFTLEQIAGDMLPGATQSQKTATGFHRCTPTNVEAGSLPEETRIEQVIDRVNTTGAVWLGVTLECCQCHDHKYDPFSTKDYYQLLAFYNNTELEADRANAKTPSSIRFIGPTMPLKDAVRDPIRAEAENQLAALQTKQLRRRTELAKELGVWATEFAVSLGDQPLSHPLELVQFQSQGTTDSHRVLEDGAVLLVGDDPPDVDTYSVTMRSDLRKVTAFRLEVLRHEALPGMGPGRGDPIRRNFVLHEFSAEIGDRKLEFVRAVADFSQARWSIQGAVDGNLKTGWAVSPQFDRSHEATFVLKQPIELCNEEPISFALRQNYGGARTIGCFRLTAVTGNVDAKTVPQSIVATVNTPTKQWTKKQRAELLDYRIEQDGIYADLSKQIQIQKKRIEALKPDTTLVMIEMETGLAKAQSLTEATIEIRGTKSNPTHHRSCTNFRQARATASRWPSGSYLNENPLVARVTVNRWWGELFGAGIVATAEDFRDQGRIAVASGVARLARS